jgi:hypothetical protein
VSTFLKPVLALIVSILIFAGFAYLADLGLVDFIQTRFYNPSVVKSYVDENTTDAEIVHNHIIELINRFTETLSTPAVRNSFLHNQSAEDIYERSRVFGILLESTGGLQSVQFIDNNGVRIHFSTSSRDIISQSRDSTSFRNYNEDPFALSFETVSVPDGSSPKYTMDERSERIIFSFPFNDSMDVYRGTALFNVSVRALAERLIAEGRIKVSDNISVIGEPSGILLGGPEASKIDIHEKVARIWSEDILDRVVLDSEDSGVNYSLISFRTNHGVFFGRLINNYLFYISESMQLVLKLCIFLTFFLTFYFLINLKPNPVTVVRNRLKRLRDSLFNQLYVNKSASERTKWILELEQRRDEIRTELKHNLKLRKRLSAIIDGIIDKSWDELLAILKSGSDAYLPVSSAPIPAVVQEAKKVSADGDVEALEEIDEIEEVEEISEADEVEEIDEAEELDEVEEIDELDEIEEVEEIEEIEEVEAIEEIAEAEDLEELDEPEDNVINIALREALEPVSPKRRGLLDLASKFRQKKQPKGLLQLASIKAESSNDSVSTSRGLFALASEIEFGDEYPIISHDFIDLPPELDIVSPFSSMFDDLANDDFSNNDH